MIQIQMKNQKRVANFILKLPQKLQKEIMDESSSFLKDVRKSARLRAPRFSGYLASSIFIIKKGEKQVGLEVTAPWALQQETGAGLPRYVSRKHLEGWFGASRTRGVQKIATGAPKGKGGKGMVVVKKYKPFVKPALEKNLNKLTTRMSNATIRAINKS